MSTTPATPSADIEARSIPIAKINRKDSIQVRSLDESTVLEYASDFKNGAKFPPVVLFSSDTQEYFIGDGFHRINAAMRNGFQDILAEVRPGGPDEAFVFALGANNSHGLRRSNSDKVRAVKLALDKWPSYSSRKLATICGTSDTLVNKYREPTSESTANGLQSRVGVDGRSYKIPARETPAREPLNELSPEDFERLKKEREAELNQFDEPPVPPPVPPPEPPRTEREKLKLFADKFAERIKTADEERSQIQDTPTPKVRISKLSDDDFTDAWNRAVKQMTGEQVISWLMCWFDVAPVEQREIFRKRLKDSEGYLLRSPIDARPEYDTSEKGLL